MKFSVIIPAYNAERGLRACLESVQQQTYTDFEAIVVDDGSSDETGKIAEAFANVDERFRYIRQDNQGVSTTRNRGLDAAQGEFVVFLDSDDRYDPGYLQAFSQMIESNPDCDNFWCGYRIVDEAGNDKGRCLWAEESDQLQILDRSEIMDLHAKALDGALWNKVFRKRILDEHEIKMRKELSLGEDMLFNFCYLDVGRPEIVMSSQPLYIYTKAENGTLDSKYRSDLKQIYDILDEEIFSFLQKWNAAPEQFTKYYNSVFYGQERVLYNTYRPECNMTSAEKRKFNNSLIRSDKFQKALKKSDCGIHPLYRFAYKIGSWGLVMLADRMTALKKSMDKRN